MRFHAGIKFFEDVKGKYLTNRLLHYIMFTLVKEIFIFEVLDKNFYLWYTNDAKQTE